MSDSTAAALVGPGRAGTAIALALRAVGVRITAVAGRAPEARSTVDVAALLGATPTTVEDAGRDVDLVIVATPDAAIEDTARLLAPSLEADALVVHLSGARGLDALAPISDSRADVEVGALHPLQTLPSGEVGAERLAGAWAAIAGPPRVDGLARSLGLRTFRVPDDHRAAYHAAACIAANHLVALLAQVERVAAIAGVPLEAFEPLVRATVDNTFALGPKAALTGPVARGDAETVSRHIDVLSPDERYAYRALAEAAHRITGADDAELRALLTGRPIEAIA